MSTFFAELKRRNVFKVGVAYAIVAWLLIEIVATVFPLLTLPDWSARLITVVILIGFPIAVFLAWAYELTPEGIKATSTVDRSQHIPSSTGQRFNYIILGLLALAVVFMLLDNYVFEDKGGKTTSASVGNSTSITTSGAGVMPAETATTPVTVSSKRMRLATLMLGDNQSKNTIGMDAFIALTRDGEHLVYSAQLDGNSRLYYRSLDQLTARPIPGTEGAYDAFFSPDGEWVVYDIFPGGLYKVAVAGGTPQLLVKNISLSRGVFWSEDDIIYFSDNNGKLSNVSADGGTPKPVVLQSEYTSWYHAWPNGLPGGMQLLLTVHRRNLNAYEGNIILLDLATGETQTLIHNGFNARYVPTGHIVFMRSGSLWAVPFDIKQLKITGQEVPVINGIQSYGGLGPAVFAISDAGFLIYLPGKDQGKFNSMIGMITNLVWVDREGKETPLGMKPDVYQISVLSPDETQVATMMGPLGYSTDIWTYDINRGTLSRRTFNGHAGPPLWTPDGLRLVYTFIPDWKGISQVNADGTGQPEELLNEPRYLLPTSFTPDGSQLLYFELVPNPGDVYSLSMAGEHTERPLLATKFHELHATLSPDGRWLAYDSDETGRFEIYVRPYPNVDEGKWQVSTEGGSEPRWRGDGKELFYRRGDTNPLTMYAVSVETSPRFQTGKPVELFHGNYSATGAPIKYDVTADGKRFLMMKAVDAGTSNEDEVANRQVNLVLVDNWFEELKRLAPPAN